MTEAAFNFWQQWYPIAPLEDLDPKRPTSVMVLGQRFVIWKPTHSEQYRVFRDECPHRLAPLSEGRIDEASGDLMCSYHGWQFNSQGKCTRVPQAENPDLIAKNQHLCAIALPCQQANDLLWLWADADSADLARSTPLPLSPQVDAEQGFVWSSMVRDLAYDWKHLIENLCDPSHVPFAHHGVQGNREQGRPQPIEILQSTPTLIEAVVTTGLKSQLTFEPPCRLEYAIKFGDGRQAGLVTYCIPVAPGRSRIVLQFPNNFTKPSHHLIPRWWDHIRNLKVVLFPTFTHNPLTPRWWDHIRNRNAVLDGDMILLHNQEHNLQKRQASQSWKTAYQMPTGSDRLVIEFYKWCDRYAQQLPWANTPSLAPEPQSSRREALLDRYQQHTSICHSCHHALHTVQRLQIGLLVFFTVAVAIAALLPDVWRLTIGLPLLFLALSGLGVYGWLKFWLEPQFYFVDYIHSDR